MSSITLEAVAASEQRPMRAGLLMSITTESQLLSTLHFVKVDGFSYSYGETTPGGIAFRAINGTYDPDAGVVNPKVEKLVPFGGIIQVDYTMEGRPAHVNAVMAKTRAAGLFFDYMAINGDSQTDPKAFDGLKTRLVGNQVIYAGTNGGDLSTDLLEQLLDSVAGPNSAKVLIMSKYQRRELKHLLLTAASGATLADTSTPIDAYDRAKIIVMDEDDVALPVLPQTETRGTSNVTGSIYCIRPGLDPEGEFLQGLIFGEMIRHKPLAQVNTQVGDLIEMFAGIGIFHGRAAARLAGLK